MGSRPGTAGAQAEGGVAASRGGHRKDSGWLRSRRRMAARMRSRSAVRTPRERSATLKAHQKLTPTLSTPVAANPATHHHSAGSASADQPSAPRAAPSWPVDSVTWRTSIGSPKKASRAGTSPSIMPSETLAATPEMFARHHAAQRFARGAPSRATMRGFQAIALSSRCSTNQFSAQPAISELANSSTPVKAANSAVGPSSVSACSECSASAAPTSGAPNSATHSSWIARTSGPQATRLPRMPAA